MEGVNKQRVCWSCLDFCTPLTDVATKEISFLDACMLSKYKVGTDNLHQKKLPFLECSVLRWRMLSLKKQGCKFLKWDLPMTHFYFSWFLPTCYFSNTASGNK